MAYTADGKVTIPVDLNTGKVDKDIAKLKGKIGELERSISRMKDQKLGLTKEAERAAALLDEAKARLYEMKNAPAGMFSKEDIADQQERVRLLQADYNRAANAVERIDQKLVTANNDLTDMRMEVAGLEQQLTGAADGAGSLVPPLKLADHHMEKFVNRIKSLAKRVFVFSLVTLALRSMRTWLWNVIRSNKEATAAIAKLKGALLTLAQPIINVVIPAFVNLINVLTRIVTALARVVSTIFGTTIEKSAESAKKLNKETKALKATGSAAKKARKAMASFDEINQLTDPKTGGGDTSIAPDFSSGSGGAQGVLAMLATGAALLAIGAILTFSGANIPLGLTLMALGAATLYTAAQMDPDTIEKLLGGVNWKVVALVGLVAVVIGILLLCTGNIALGIGAIALGATAIFAAYTFDKNGILDLIKSDVFAKCLIIGGILAVVLGVILICAGQIALGIGGIVLGAVALFTAYQLNPEKFNEIIHSEALTTDFVIGGVLAIMLGIILICAGQIPFGIGAIVLGVGALFAAYKLNPDGVKKLVDGPVGTAIAVVGLVAIALGVILCCAGLIPLGVGAIAVGAAAVVSMLAFNPEKIQEMLQGPIGLAVGVVSAALLVLGIILLLTGGGIPLGLGLIAVGAVGLATAIAPNWDWIVEKIKGVWSKITGFWNSTMKPKLDAVKEFIGNLLTDPIGTIKNGINSILGCIEFLVNKIISGLNGMISSINKISLDVPDWVPGLGGKKLGFNLRQLSAVSIPRLAQGMVIPANNEFLAVLGDQKRGTNVEAPLDTIKQALREVQAESGSAGGRITLVIQTAPGFARYLKYELDEETTRQGVRLVQGV